MAKSTPRFETGSNSPGEPTFPEFVDRHADRHVRYGSGKVALRDGLLAIRDGFRPKRDGNPTGSTSEGTVLLPAYLPDAIGEPIVDAGYDPEYYAVRRDLGPDLADLERRLDERTAAVVSVDYFGFPGPNVDRAASLAAAYDCYHVEDSAHSAISLHEGELLGTRTDFGITSLRKLLPVSGGALLYLNDPDLVERFEPSDCAGVCDRFTANDGAFLLSSVANQVRERNAFARRSIDALASYAASDVGSTPPRERYEASKTRMSKLTYRRFRGADPRSIRSDRRAKYRAWERVLEPLPAVQPVFDTLPEGICPQACPVRTVDQRSLLGELESRGVDAFTWPRLPEAVRADPEYGTAADLAREIVALPVDRRLTPERIESIGGGLRG